MEFISSPNFGERRPGKNNGAKIQHLILHYTDTPTLKMAVDMLLDPAHQASAHYVVDLNGDIVQMVDEPKRAWHAGKSFWAGETDINSTSIGIEIVNPGHTFGHQPYPDIQISAVIKLCQDIITRHDILPHHVLAHSDISPDRKKDPGVLFPWKLLAENGVGLFPNIPLPQRNALGERSGEGVVSQSPSPNLSPASGGEALAKYGYDISNLPAAIIAFQRHFRPKKLTGEWDDECGKILAELFAIRQRI